MTLNLTQSRDEEENYRGARIIQTNYSAGFRGWKANKNKPCCTAAFPVEKVNAGASLHSCVLPFTAFSRAKSCYGEVECDFADD